MTWNLPGNVFLPEKQGEFVVNVSAADAETLNLLFGDHADEAADIIRRNEQRPINKYVQLVPVPMPNGERPLQISEQEIVGAPD